MQFFLKCITLALDANFFKKWTQKLTSCLFSTHIHIYIYIEIIHTYHIHRVFASFWEFIYSEFQFPPKQSMYVILNSLPHQQKYQFCFYTINFTICVCVCDYYLFIFCFSNWGGGKVRAGMEQHFPSCPGAWMDGMVQ